MTNRSSRRDFEEYRRQRKHGRRKRPTGRVDVSGGHRAAYGGQLAGGLCDVLKGQRLAIVFALVLLTISTALALVPAAATKVIIDYVLTDRPLPDTWPHWLGLPSGRQQLLFWLAGVMISVSLIEVTVRLASRWYMTKAETCAQVALRKKVFQHALRLPLNKIHQLKSGGAASILRDDVGRIAELLRALVYNPWRALIQLAGSLCILFYIDWRLLLGASFVLPLVYLNHRSWHRRIRPLYRDISMRRQQSDSHVTEAFGGMRVVRAFGRARREATRFARANHLIARIQLYTFRARSLESMWEVVTVAGSIGVLLYGGARVIHGDLSLGDLIMFMSFLAMLLGPLESLAKSSNELQNHLACFERVLELLAEPQELDSRCGAVCLRRGSVEGKVTLSGASFHYPGSSLPALSDIDLEARPGETLALVGRSGAGKTTLSNLVARFYEPTAGTLELDGRDVRDIRADSYRKLLGIVEQDVFLFDGTIAENIGYAVPRATMLEIERAARAAHVHEFVRQMEHGYETRIGERGVRLSGGQRQRLAIARALLADPRILIFDEATSNLDSESEQFIQQSLDKLRRGRTCFVIAHRLSTILRADRIVVLEAGRIVEMGSHDDLFSRGGRYRQMVEVQTLDQPALVRVA